MLRKSEFRRHAKLGDYQPLLGCHCLNIVTAVIDYYKRMPAPYRLKTIFLNAKHWKLFSEDLKRLQENKELADMNKGCEINAAEGVQFDGCDVTVKLGGKFQQKEMKYEFYPVDIKEIASC